MDSKQQRGEDGELWWPNIPAAGFRTRVVPAVLDGQAVAVGVHVELMPGERLRPLTQTVLKSVPLAHLAAFAAAEDVANFVRSFSAPLSSAAAERMGTNLRSAVAALRSTNAVEVDPQIERVADIWNAAYARKGAPRSEVVAAGHVSARTADRLIAQARAAGLIVAPRRGGGRRGPKTTDDK